jgi:hypothetical protein
MRVSSKSAMPGLSLDDIKRLCPSLAVIYERSFVALVDSDVCNDHDSHASATNACSGALQLGEAGTALSGYP